MGKLEHCEVYFCTGGDVYYYWRGAACDAAIRIFGNSSSVASAILYYREDDKPRFDAASGNCLNKVYTYFSSDLWYSECYLSPLFVHEEDLTEYLVENSRASEEGTILTREFSCYKPSLPDPLIVIFRPNRKGNGVFTTLVSRSEEDGLFSRGKVFFPDKNWTNVQEGRAKVRITKEFDTYGFVVGEMLYDTITSGDAALDFFKKKMQPWDTVYLFTDTYTGSPCWGYLVNGTCQTIICDAVTGSLAASGRNTLAQMEKTKSWSGYAVIAFLMANWEKTEKEVRDLIDSFEQSTFYVDWKEGIKATIECDWSYDCSEVIPKGLLYTAVEIGLVEQIGIMGIPSIAVYSVFLDNAFKFCNFSYDQAKELSVLANKANQEADNRIRGMLKRGVLRSRGSYRSVLSDL